MEKGESSCTADGTVNWEQPLQRTVFRVLEKLKIELPCNSATPLLDTHTEKTQFKKAHAPQCS